MGAKQGQVCSLRRTTGALAQRVPCGGATQRRLCLSHLWLRISDSVAFLGPVPPTPCQRTDLSLDARPLLPHSRLPPGTSSAVLALGCSGGQPRAPHPHPLCSAVPVQEAHDHVQLKNKNETTRPYHSAEETEVQRLGASCADLKVVVSTRGVFIALPAAPGSWLGTVVVRGPADTRVRALPGSWEHRIWAIPGPGPGPWDPQLLCRVVAYPAR